MKHCVSTNKLMTFHVIVDFAATSKSGYSPLNGILCFYE
jgi:hypothetical protein